MFLKLFALKPQFGALEHGNGVNIEVHRFMNSVNSNNIYSFL